MVILDGFQNKKISKYMIMKNKKIIIIKLKVIKIN